MLEVYGAGGGYINDSSKICLKKDPMSFHPWKVHTGLIGSAYATSLRRIFFVFRASVRGVFLFPNTIKFSVG